MNFDNKTCKADKILHNLIDKHICDISIAILLIMSFAIRLFLAPHAFSIDYRDFSRWMDEYRNYTFLGGLGHKITAYYEPYNWLLDFFAHTTLPNWASLTLISCTFEYIGTFFLFRCILIEGEKNKIENIKHKAEFASVAILFIPVTFINGALWKQCDAVYTCFAIISIYYFLQNKYTKSFLFLSISFVFKLQAVFLLPFYLIMYICQNEFSIVQFFQLPAMYLITGLPAVWMKKGLKNTYFTYLNQTKSPMNIPGWRSHPFR
jgi:Gpi18-like mannosyltransferase